MKIKNTILTLFFLLLPMVFFAQGFDENYEVLQGDYNGDGNIDLYVRQKPQVVLIHGDIITPIVILPGVKEFVLIQNTDSTFLMDIEASNANNIQWQETAIQIVLNDLNVDKVLDVVLKGVGDLIVGADDQVVMASFDKGHAPLAVTAVDEEFKQFFEEVSNWLSNPDYFDENAPLVRRQIGTRIEYEERFEAIEVCQLFTCREEMNGWVSCPSAGECTPIPECRQYYCESILGQLGYRHRVAIEVPVYGMVPDYSVFNQDALAFKEAGFQKVPVGSQGQVILSAVLILLDVVFGDQVEEVLEKVKPEILETTGEKVGILNNDKAVQLILILAGKCTLEIESEACIVDVEEIILEQLEREDIDDDKLDLETLGILIDVLRKAEAVRSKDSTRTNCTYIKQNLGGSKFYYGRTSGHGSCETLVKQRDAQHRAGGKLAELGAAYVDRGASGIDGYSAIRGREQQLIDYHVYDIDNGAWTGATQGLDLSPGIVKNVIRGVARKNPLGCSYWLLSTELWSEKGPYTGKRSIAICNSIPLFPEEY